MHSRTRTVMTYAVPIILVGLTGWYMASGMRSEDWSLVGRDVLSLDPTLMIITLLTAVLAHVSRAMRWGYLLRPTRETIPLGASFNAVMIGYAANAIVPRAGEVARPLVLSQRLKIPAESTIGSVLLERVLDVVTLLIGMLLATAYAQPKVAETFEAMRGVAPSLFATADASVAVTNLTVLLVVLIMGIVVVLFTSLGEWIIRATIGRVSARLSDRLVRSMSRLRQGLHAIRSPRLLVPILAHTMLIWVLYAATTWCVIRALPYSSTSAAGPADATLMLVILAIAVTIAPTPGAIGVYNVAGQVTLMSLYGATPAEGFVFAMVSWLINQGLALGIGGVSWILESRAGIHIRLFSKSQSRENASA